MKHLKILALNGVFAASSGFACELAQIQKFITIPSRFTYLGKSEQSGMNLQMWREAKTTIVATCSAEGSTMQDGFKEVSNTPGLALKRLDSFGIAAGVDNTFSWTFLSGIDEILPNGGLKFLIQVSGDKTFSIQKFNSLQTELASSKWGGIPALKISAIGRKEHLFLSKVVSGNLGLESKNGSRFTLSCTQAHDDTLVQEQIRLKKSLDKKTLVQIKGEKLTAELQESDGSFYSQHTVTNKQYCFVIGHSKSKATEGMVKLKNSVEKILLAIIP